MSREVEQFLFGLRARGVKPGLRPVRAVLDALGAPDRAVPVLQVVGTVGKGSTTAMAASVLQAAGLRAARFTSPHLVRYRERFVVDGEMVGEAALDDAVARVRREVPWAAGDAEAPAGLRPLTFFEWSTVLAWVLFAAAGAEVVVLECGLGGRWDATTACHADVVAVSRIGLDHMGTLGDTLAAIAGEKAAAIRAGRPVVTVDQVPEAAAVVTARAAEVGAPLTVLGDQVSVSPAEDTDRFTYHGRSLVADELALPLIGAHQVENAGLALAAVEALAAVRGLAVDASAMRRGLASVAWPGRLEEVSPGVWVDGAHNRPAAEALAAAVAERFPGRQVHLVFAVLEGRDPVSILEPLLPLAETVTLTMAGGDRACDPASYAETVRSRHRAVRVEPGPAAALASAGRPALVCGSLYLAGEVRAAATGLSPDPGDPSAPGVSP